MFYTILTGCTLAALICTAVLPVFLCADTAKPSSDSALQLAADSSKSWLSLLDKHQYGQSWDQASKVTQTTVGKDDWISILEKTRKPLGSVTTREVVDQRTAKNPKGMPEGDYVVMIYKTVFAHQPAQIELVTLYLENGKWHVVTYQVGSQ
jgi:hypothetical protein